MNDGKAKLEQERADEPEVCLACSAQWLIKTSRARAVLHVHPLGNKGRDDYGSEGSETGREKLLQDLGC